MIEELVPIDSIKVVGRYRTDMGDVQELADSIKKITLLHPVSVTPDRRLISGQRRIEAFRLLKRDRIPVRVITDMDDASSLLIAERDENTCRKDMLWSELVALGRALEALERPKAKERQATHGAAPGRPKNTSGHLSGSVQKETRDVVGQALGLSGRTYQRAKAVVDSGDTALIEEMDSGGKVSPVYSKLRAKQTSHNKVADDIERPKMYQRSNAKQMEACLAASHGWHGMDELDYSIYPTEQRAQWAKELTQLIRVMSRVRKQLNRADVAQ